MPSRLCRKGLMRLDMFCPKPMVIFLCAVTLVWKVIGPDRGMTSTRIILSSACGLLLHTQTADSCRSFYLRARKTVRSPRPRLL